MPTIHIQVEILVGEDEYEGVDVSVEASACDKPSDDPVAVYEYDDDYEGDDATADTESEFDEVSCAEVIIVYIMMFSHS